MRGATLLSSFGKGQAHCKAKDKIMADNLEDPGLDTIMGCLL